MPCTGTVSQLFALFDYKVLKKLLFIFLEEAEVFPTKSENVIVPFDLLGKFGPLSQKLVTFASSLLKISSFKRVPLVARVP